ncbi:MAG TPA: hypothetical protein VJZ04_01545 [Lachnospiraceae bacterium]|nr:hypothetical protein [Lachnospiraceae bacterium]
MGEKEKTEVIFRLSNFVRKGVILYIDGELSTLEDVVKCYCVNEESMYMPDYVMNEAGMLKELRYDKINKVI